MRASYPMQPSGRGHRDLATREAGRRVTGEWSLVEFRPARWLWIAITLVSLWLVGPMLGKRALLALAWRFTPRRLKLIAGGITALAFVLVAGSVAALVLMLDQVA